MNSFSALVSLFIPYRLVDLRPHCHDAVDVFVECFQFLGREPWVVRHVKDHLAKHSVDLLPLCQVVPPVALSISSMSRSTFLMYMSMQLLMTTALRTSGLTVREPLARIKLPKRPRLRQASIASVARADLLHRSRPDRFAFGRSALRVQGAGCDRPSTIEPPINGDMECDINLRYLLARYLVQPVDDHC